MKAKNLLHQRHVISETEFFEIVVWEVPENVKGSEHLYKYSLAYVKRGKCKIRFDNEAGKGDHFHVEEIEKSFEFKSVDQLVDDFLTCIDQWRQI